MAFTRNGALEYLSRAYEHGRLAHAYLISGTAGQRQARTRIRSFQSGDRRNGS